MALRRFFGSLGPLAASALRANPPAALAAFVCRRWDSSSSSSSPPSPPSAQDVLMQFFDAKRNWNEMEVKVGRSWRADELRLKSNSDLHRLWYVLLKERNMLKTMEHECAAHYRLFPSPERIDKVDESMQNLETVVRERNRAYHTLETGSNGERPVELARNQIGMHYNYKAAEHVLPKQYNKVWTEKKVIRRWGGCAVKKFLTRYIEKSVKGKRRDGNRARNHVMQLLKRFPNMDMQALKEQFPEVDVEKAKRDKKSHGHFIPKEYQF